MRPLDKCSTFLLFFKK